MRPFSLAAGLERTEREGFNARRKTCRALPVVATTFSVVFALTNIAALLALTVLKTIRTRNIEFVVDALVLSLQCADTNGDLPGYSVVARQDASHLLHAETFLGIFRLGDNQSASQPVDSA